ncbi:MAG: dihydrofolate reductase [Clostridia bacterium]
MKAVVVCDNNWGIGKENKLLFSLKEDMKRFKSLTIHNIVVMGSNTLKSLPNSQPLKDRINIVLSSTLDRTDCIVAKNKEALFDIIKNLNSDEIFIIGGAKVYHLLLNYCDRAYVTKVDADGDAEVFFDNLDENENWQCVSVSEPLESNGKILRFTEYKNLNVKTI